MHFCDVIGTHLTWEIMMMLLRGSADYIQQSKVVCMLDTPACADIDTHFPKSRVLNTHYPLDVLPNQFHDRKTVLGKDRKTDPAMLIIYCCKPDLKPHVH